MTFESVLAALGALGGTAIVVAGLSAWLGKVWAERIYLRTAHKLDLELDLIRRSAERELEEVRALREGERDARAARRDLLAKASLATQERALKALESVWRTVVAVREFTGPFLFAHDVLLPHERAAVRDDTAGPFVPRLTLEQFTKRLSEFSQVENERPFLGERFWQLFSVYRQFALRMAYKALQPERQVGGKPAAVRIPEWNQSPDGSPDQLTQVVTFALSEDELKTAIGDGRTGVPRRILDAIERKMLEEMNVALFGRRLLEMGLGDQQRLAELIQLTSSQKGHGDV
jgi:hypothetical protein